MQNDITAHVQPLVLWQYVCGGRDLPKSDYIHLVKCIDCKTLGDQISEALQDIENKVGRRHPHAAVS
jgi:hypothetical protein